MSFMQYPTVTITVSALSVSLQHKIYSLTLTDVSSESGHCDNIYNYYCVVRCNI